MLIARLAVPGSGFTTGWRAFHGHLCVVLLLDSCWLVLFCLVVGWLVWLHSFGLVCWLDTVVPVWVITLQLVCVFVTLTRLRFYWFNGLFGWLVQLPSCCSWFGCPAHVCVWVGWLLAATTPLPSWLRYARCVYVSQLRWFVRARLQLRTFSCCGCLQLVPFAFGWFALLGCFAFFCLVWFARLPSLRWLLFGYLRCSGWLF